MKKNTMMRIASVLLVVVLLTTSVISGTFAKYITSDDAQDSARVAKFGVVVTAAGSLFDDTYINAPEVDVDAATVVAKDSTNVVAPGTKNEDGITFTLSGTPEVDVKLDVVVTNGYKEVFLAQKDDLPDMTTGNVTDTFDNTAVYYPVKFTLTQTNELGTTTLVDAGRLDAVETKLEALSSTNIAANTDLSKKIGTLKLTWAWDFDDSGTGTYDKQDTLLGDLAAGTTLTPATTLTAGTDYYLNTNVEIAITVTQVD